MGAKIEHSVKDSEKPLSRLSGWCAAAAQAVKALAPKEMAKRLKEESDSQAVAAQIMKAISRGTARAADSMLTEALEVYGHAAFERAMSKRCWSVDGGIESRLITPAEACAITLSVRWVEILAEMVPKSHWADRTRISKAYEWKEPEEVGKRGIEIESVGPLLRVCIASGRDNWEKAFEAVSRHIPTPDKAEALACKASLNTHFQDTAWSIWFEKVQLGEVAPDTAGRSLRRSAL